MTLQEDRLERDRDTFSQMLLIPGINTWLQRGCIMPKASPELCLWLTFCLVLVLENLSWCHSTDRRLTIHFSCLHYVHKSNTCYLASHLWNSQEFPSRHHFSQFQEDSIVLWTGWVLFCCFVLPNIWWNLIMYHWTLLRKIIFHGCMATEDVS